MFQNMKRRLAVLLVMSMVVSCLTAAIPALSQDVEAAESFSIFTALFTSKDYPLNVEQGQEFNIGDYVNIFMPNSVRKTASLMPCSYTSSNSKVATVNEKGVVNTLSKGSVMITIDYKGSSDVYYLKIVSSGSFSSKSGVSQVKAAALALEKAIPSEVTLENGYNFLKSMEIYKKTVDQYSDTMRPAGWTYNKELLVPQAGVYNRADSLLDDYAYKNSPTATTSAKQLKIKSVSASVKKNVIKVNLKNAITKENVLALQIENRNMGTKNNVVVWIYDTNDHNYTYYGMGVAKAGKKTLELKLKYQTYSSKGKLKFVTKKLKAGHKYKIGSNRKREEGYWARGKKVKAK